MHIATVSLRNFRCFDWNNPAILEFHYGLTALIGPNNAGKSAALRSIYELRSVWQSIFACLMPHAQYSARAEPTGVSDITELANSDDPTRIEISISLNNSPTDNNPNHYHITHIEVLYDLENRSITPKLIKGKNISGSTHTLNEQTIKSANQISGSIITYSRITMNFSALVSFLNDLSRARFFPAFRNAINEGASNYYDMPVGTALVSTWDTWKAGNVKKSKVAIGRVERKIAELLGFNSLQINADSQRKSLDVYINGHPHKLYEIGSGVAQLVMTLASALVMEPTYILIDEPELSLHPTLQLSFLAALFEYCSKGLLFATHSYGLARTAAERILVVQRSHATKMQPLNSNSINLAELLGELGYAARLEIGCERILLVEGPTDVLFFQEFLRKLKIDQKYVIMQLGGSSLINGNISTHLSEICRISDAKNIKIFIDSERKSASEPLSPERENFVSACKQFGIEVAVSERRATENYFEENAIRKALGGDYKPLEPFQLLKECSKPWHKSQNWKIARETEFADIESTDLGKFLRSLEQ
ncbi:AAA family ATPase [Burkholderia contaminans]|uniref:ATP-dependent nuclease n=1 Tax=Burkholderia contaminans TaxID=488447 RepID=UPI001CF27235|nr:AAA family ATPase [Burkholderia contaminans]MCA7913323.1 AAA family ATPase [Burkholderia contaminans]UUX39844.1 AAA family ATPase [Burkholderia contaminans]